MSATFNILTAEGDRWLKRATDTYTGGGDFAVASAEAAIASAHYARAMIEKPDTLAALLQAQQLAAAAQARQQDSAPTTAPAKRGRTNGAPSGIGTPRAGRGSTKRATKQ